jgi:hypothetical protein
MERELEAIRQQLLEHHPPLIAARLTLSVGFRKDVVLVLPEPCRSARDLVRMKPIRERDEIAQRCIDR